MKYKGLKKRIECLSELVESDTELTLTDGSKVQLTFKQFETGCVDAISSIESYESYVCEHAVSGSGSAGLTLALLAAVLNPFER
jgi:hypothetical protein